MARTSILLFLSSIIGGCAETSPPAFDPTGVWVMAYEKPGESGPQLVGFKVPGQWQLTFDASGGVAHTGGAGGMGLMGVSLADLNRRVKTRWAVSPSGRELVLTLSAIRPAAGQEFTEITWSFDIVSESRIEIDVDSLFPASLRSELELGTAGDRMILTRKK